MQILKYTTVLVLAFMGLLTAFGGFSGAVSWKDEVSVPLCVIMVFIGIDLLYAAHLLMMSE